MIRLMQGEDRNKVMDIWITATISAHRFINQSYWLKLYRKIKNITLDKASTYVICEDDSIVGFAAVYDKQLLALYIVCGRQGKGYGTSLLKHLQNQYQELQANVYVKNPDAVRFFGFVKKSV